MRGWDGSGVLRAATSALAPITAPTAASAASGDSPCALSAMRSGPFEVVAAADPLVVDEDLRRGPDALLLLERVHLRAGP